MTEHSDLATGNLKGLSGKERSNALWQRLVTSLNVAGPPMRSTDKWKKVSLFNFEEILSLPKFKFQGLERL